MDIDCVDWHREGDSSTAADQQHLPDAIRVNSVGQMVRLIDLRLANDRIRRLRIFGHGDPGVQGLGNSISSQTHLYNQITTDTGTRVTYANVLGGLRGKFAQGAWVELHGCSVGAGAAGWNLLKGLAQLWQVKVAAGVVDQDDGGGFEGAYYRVAWPDGRVYSRRGHP